MIVVLKRDADVKSQEQLTKWLEESFGVKVSPIKGSEMTILGLIGDTNSIDTEALAMYDIVEKVMKVMEPFKKANRKFHPDDTLIEVGDVKIGGNKIVIMGGPCSVESEEQIMTVSSAVKNSGADILRGGAFKPRTSPYAFQGLRAEGLMLLKKAREATGLRVISEITNPFHIDLFVEYVDVIQVGARNMQNFELLKALGKTSKPILLKRGFANSIDELLMSAEYIMSGGNEKVILCERGIRTFETYYRNTLDISAIPALKKLSHLPVIVDPSHASGKSWMVEPLSKAAIAAGADGLIIEVHDNPKAALSDGAQSLTVETFAQLVDGLKPIAQAVGRSV